MSRSGQLPRAERLSVLSGVILLAYATSRFIDLPLREVSIQLPGFFLAIDINLQIIVTFLVAGLTATGADFLVREHPHLSGRRTLEHWLLPALTAGVLAVPLYRMPIGVAWILSFAIGGALLMLVLISEYIVVDADDVRYPLASSGLAAVSFALFLLLAIGLRSAGLRLFFILPALTFSLFLVILRTLNLRAHGHQLVMPSLAVTLIAAQIMTTLHYWPLAPITFGLAILGPAYSLTSFMGGLVQGEPWRQAIVEPGIVLLVVLGITIWIS